MWGKIAFLAIAVFFLAFPAFPEEPAVRYRSPCITDGTFDKDKCREVALWIAVGTATDIKTLPYPTDNPMTEFTLQVTEWEKGPPRTTKRKEIKHLKGFPRAPEPGDLVRVYGTQVIKHLPDEEYRSYYLETLDEERR